jgi:sporulation protein YlmC with PRC-barrel domain
MKSYDPDVRSTNDANREHRDDDGRLVHLDEVKGRYRVAEGNPDIRGWDVRASEGRKVGEVDDLVIDTGKCKVRYIEVKVDKDITGTDDDRRMLFPIGRARLDNDADEVRLDATASDMRDMPARNRGRFSADDDRDLRERFHGQGRDVSRYRTREAGRRSRRPRRNGPTRVDRLNLTPLRRHGSICRIVAPTCSLAAERWIRALEVCGDLSVERLLR